MAAVSLWRICAWLVLLTLQTSSVIGQAGSQYTFEVQVLSYRNSGSRATEEQDCCRGRCDTCRNTFTFCATTADATVSDSGTITCTLGLYQFQQDDDDITFMNGAQIVPGEDIPNPIPFRSDNEPWSGGFRFIVHIVHDDDTVVDQVNVIMPNFNQKTFANPQTFTGRFGNSEIELSFRLSCSENFYGPNCETNCTPRDDSGGHYTCNPNSGEIVCLPGYTNPSTNCVTCASILNCANTADICTSVVCLNGGTCLATSDDQDGRSYKCTCAVGFEGANCEMEATANPPTNPSNNPPTSSSSSNPSTSPMTVAAESTTKSATDLIEQLPQSSGLSRGGVAGLVIGLLLVLLLLAAAGVAIGVIVWKCRRRISAKFDVRKNKDTMDNPTYDVVEMTPNSPYSATSTVSPPPVYATATQLNHHERVPTLERTLDNDNPLYFSTAFEASENDYAIPPDAHALRLSQDSDTHDYEVPPEEIRYPQEDLESRYLKHLPPTHPPPRRPDKKVTALDNSNNYLAPYKAASSSKSSPSHSTHSCGTHPTSPLNPYGEYGDNTLKRVASQQSVNKEDGEGPMEISKGLFDNEDYEDRADLDLSRAEAAVGVFDNPDYEDRDNLDFSQ